MRGSPLSGRGYEGAAPLSGRGHEGAAPLVEGIMKGSPSEGKKGHEDCY